MEQILKERLFGAAIIVGLGVLFLPAILEEKRVQGKRAQELFSEPMQAQPAAEQYVQPREALAASPDFGGVAKKTIVQEQKSVETAVVVEAPSVPVVPPVAPLAQETPLIVEKESSVALEHTVTPPAVVEPPPALLAEPTKVPEAAFVWSVQLGLFSNRHNAEALVLKLKEAGYKAYALHSTGSQGAFMKVLIGPELEKQSAVALIPQLEKRFQLKGILVRYQPGVL